MLWPLDADGAVRRFNERLAADGSLAPTLAGQIARKLGREPGHRVIDYPVGRPFDYLLMQALLAAAQSGRLDDYRAAIEGQVVLIGPLHQFEDRKRQHLNLMRVDSARADPPGLLLHAQTLRSVLGDGLIRPLPEWIALLLALAAATLRLVPLTPWRAVLLIAAPCLLVLAASLLLLSHQRFLPVALAVAGILLAVSARGAYRNAVAALQRGRPRAALRGYVSPQVAEDVNSGRLPSGFAGERYTLCVMFVDMRDFTPRSERLTPEAMARASLTGLVSGALLQAALPTTSATRRSAA